MLAIHGFNTKLCMNFFLPQNYGFDYWSHNFTFVLINGWKHLRPLFSLGYHLQYFIGSIWFKRLHSNVKNDWHTIWGGILEQFSMVHHTFWMISWNFVDAVVDLRQATNWKDIFERTKLENNWPILIRNQFRSFIKQLLNGFDEIDRLWISKC